jgi:hypothetical protein
MTIANHRGQRVMAISKNIGFNPDLFPDGALDWKIPQIHARQDVLDDHATGGCRKIAHEIMCWAENSKRISKEIRALRCQTLPAPGSA